MTSSSPPNPFPKRSGLARGVPVRHTVLLCAVLGPVGLLSHLVTCCSAAANSEGTAAPALAPAPEAA